MLGIGREYRNTRYETTGNVQVVLLSSQHSLAVSSLVVCVCVCVCNHFPKPFHEKLRFISVSSCSDTWGTWLWVTGAVYAASLYGLRTWTNSVVGAVRGNVLGEMFTSAVWWVNESLSDWRVFVLVVWYRVDMLRFDELRVEFRVDKPYVSRTVNPWVTVAVRKVWFA